MEAGVAVWLKDAKSDLAWSPSVVQSKEYKEGKIVIIVRNTVTGVDLTFQVNDDSQDIDFLKLRNDPGEDRVENLINLPYLHEPAILYCLEERYSSSNIYTFTGPILIAVNPFKPVPLYSPQILESYYNLGLLRSQEIENLDPLPPHVYSIADAAYRSMMKSMSAFSAGNPAAVTSIGSLAAAAASVSATSADQCILISGESGAGKTESTKIVLRYLTTVGNASGQMHLESGSVMDKVLQSNPILEAFGNARTIRNDNSSRFGKFIELNFNKRGHLVGGTIRTYLLEKVRLPCQQSGERNFHVFYQLVAGATEEERKRWQLGSINEYWYTNQGGVFELRNVRDGDEFGVLKNALTTLNFAAADQDALFGVMAGLLHLGQLQFSPDADGEGSIVAPGPANTDALLATCRLFGVENADLTRVLTSRQIKTVTDTVTKKLTPSQASDARDAVAKAIYGRAFDWIVRTVNKSIAVDRSAVRADIGVLDIFGFECFQHNSFEQLCINYTNETLQQQFNQFVFKMEQAEYEREKIAWSFIAFPDNQDCLDLIENRQKGILSMLDDECRLPGASDEKFASRLYKAFEPHNPRFSSNAFQKRDNCFCIHHYAGEVVYNTRSFIEKNKDELPKECDSLMQQSSVTLLAKVFEEAAVLAATTASSGSSMSAPGIGGVGTKRAGPEKAAQLSVGSQFKSQLSSLMEKIYATSPHYIRCLKPNDSNAADNFNRRRTAEQLRYGGVLEAVRVARSGFPVRLTHADFYTRYRPLANPFNALSKRLPRHIVSEATQEALDFSSQLITTLADDYLPPLPVAALSSSISMGASVEVSLQSSSYHSIMEVKQWRGQQAIPKESLQLGLTKVFLRKEAHDILEARRSRRVVAALIKIQSAYRGYFLRSRYAAMCTAARLLQRLTRGFLVRVKAFTLRRERGALRVQKVFRRFAAQSRYRYFLYSVIRLQSFHRARHARALVMVMRRVMCCALLQRVVRGTWARRTAHTRRRGIVLLQSLYRMKIARKQLQSFRAAAKDLGVLKQSNEALKAEINTLRAKATEEARRAAEASSAALELQMQAMREEMVSLKKECDIEKKLRMSAELRVVEMADTRAKDDIRLSSVVKNYESRLLRAEEALLASEAEKDKLRQHCTLLEQDILNAAQDKSIALDKLADAEAAIAHAMSSMPGSSSGSGSPMRTEPTAQVTASPSNVSKWLAPETSAQPSFAGLSSRYITQMEMAAQQEKETLTRELEHEKALRLGLQIEVDRLRNDLGVPVGVKADSVSAVESFSRSVSHGPSSHSGGLADVGSNASGVTSAASQGQEGGGSKKVPAAALTNAVAATIGTATPANPLPVRRASTDPNPELKFEKNLALFRARLKDGVRARLWEGIRFVGVEVTVKLNAVYDTLVFEQAARRLFIFSSRPEVSNIKISELADCISGAEVDNDFEDSSRLLTLMTTKSESSSAARVVALQVANRDDRNSMLTGFRTLMSYAQMNSPSSKLTRALLQSQPSPLLGSAESSAAAFPTRSSSPAFVLDSSTYSDYSHPNVNTISAVVHPSPAQKGSGRRPAGLVSRAQTRPTQQQLVGDGGNSSARARPPPAKLRAQQTEFKSVEDDDYIIDMSEEPPSRAELKKLLDIERANHQRLIIQLLNLTNDMSDRDAQIKEAKQRTHELEIALAQREKKYEQDATVRLQLGKRLEQVLMDKEEALEQLENMRDLLHAIGSSFDSMVATSPESTPIRSSSGPQVAGASVSPRALFH